MATVNLPYSISGNVGCSPELDFPPHKAMHDERKGRNGSTQMTTGMSPQALPRYQSLRTSSCEREALTSRTVENPRFFPVQPSTQPGQGTVSKPDRESTPVATQKLPRPLELCSCQAEFALAPRRDSANHALSLFQSEGMVPGDGGKLHADVAAGVGVQSHGVRDSTRVRVPVLDRPATGKKVL